jgi:hypothetical protein
MRPPKIQALKEIDAVKAAASKCEQHLPVETATLFEF